MPKEHVAIFALLCIIAFGAGYWHSTSKEDSGERVEVVAPPTPTVVTNTLREVVTNIVLVPLPTPAHIADPIVETAIRRNLGNEWGPLNTAHLAKVTSLILTDTQITDASLKEVAKLKQLTKLALRETQFTDAGLKEVAKLHKLELLGLHGTQITDAGLKELAKLQQLLILTLYRTQVTKAGVAELQKALPKCKIEHDFE